MPDRLDSHRLEGLVRDTREDLDLAWAAGDDAGVLRLLAAAGFHDVCIAAPEQRRRDQLIGAPLTRALRLYQRARGATASTRVCNFAPSCSHFALGALRRYPARWALQMIWHRLRRCDDSLVGFDLPDWDHTLSAPSARAAADPAP